MCHGGASHQRTTARMTASQRGARARRIVTSIVRALYRTTHPARSSQAPFGAAASAAPWSSR
eukprot:355846-Chlamydomonas_euryale.AAC.11